MSIVKVYEFTTFEVQDDLKLFFGYTIESQSSTQFVIPKVGILSDTFTFIGNFTLSSGNISGGTITELQVSDGNGLELDVTGVSIPVTSDGFSISFNTGAFFPTGSTYIAETHGADLTGVGNDIFYASFGTTVNPGAGVNEIIVNDTSNQINFKGSFTSDSLAIASDGSLLVIDSSASGTSYDDISGGATLLFEGDDTFVRYSAGQFTVTETAAAAIQYIDSSLSLHITVTDSAQNVSANLDGLQELAAADHLAAIMLTDSGTPTVTVSATQLTLDATALNDISGTYDLIVTGLSVAAALNSTPSNVTTFNISDSAANVAGSLDALESLASAGKLGGITLTDGGIPTVTVSPTQTVEDSSALAAIGGNYVLSVAAGATSQTIDGAAGHGAIVQFSGPASQYTVVSAGNGTGFTVSNGSFTDQMSAVTALQFSDATDFIASQTPAVTGGISSFQVASLYAAVLARTPDVAGLAYYEYVAAANPTLPITAYADWFLQSPEYTAAHSYTQTAAGDAQFITDTYTNLLHRAPASGDVAWYQANVIAPVLGAATAGSSAYAAAELQAHASVLADFSQSAEFRGDVQVTAQNPSSAQHWLILI